MPLQEAFVSVVAALSGPVADLEGRVAELAAVLAGRFTDYEIILVDDEAGAETTAAADRLLAAQPCLRVIRLTRRFGRQVAAAAGLDSAIGDVAVVLDLAQDPPGLVPALVARVRSGFGVVVGQAAVGDVAARPGRATSLAARLLRLDVGGHGATLLAFSRPALNAVTRVMQRRRNLGVVSGAIGFPLARVPYQRRPGGPPPRRSLFDRLRDARDTLVLHTTRPLRLVTGAGLLASALNLLYAGYVVAVNLFKERVAEGWTTLSLQISGMFFLVFIILTVLAEYLGKTLEESKGEPAYHVLEVKESAQSVARPDRLNVFDGRTG
jgi:glycosyltransferase involved in cell wall biosynthesis